jgi:pilus assembly protein CpaD
MRAPKPSSRARTSAGTASGAAVALVLSAGLAGCGAPIASTDPVFPGDFEQRHPIALVTGPTSVEIYAPGGRLDVRSAANLRAFAARYRRFGSGEIVILTPATEAGDMRAVEALRKTLVRAGAFGPTRVAIYDPGPHAGAAPIRVAFTGLKAEVATPCGRWPEDLASGSSLEGWRNESYANFGCASQAMLAAEVDDPHDFVTPRALAPADTATRMRAIDAVRKGEDPGTQWKTDLTPIGGGVTSPTGGGS